MIRQRIVRIRTPEGIVFPMVPADPVTRLLALAIDLAAISLIGAALSSVTSLTGIISADLAAAAGILVSFVLSIGYPVALEWGWRGQTLGKRVMRIRVVDEQGMKLQPSQVVIRNLLRAVDALPAFYMVGGISCLLSHRVQRLGDIAASTIVVRVPKTETPDLDAILPDKYNSFRQYPHVAARLRQFVGPAEASLALRALVRRGSLDEKGRLEVFAALAAHFKAVAPFPGEATDGISDERYVRNVIDILYRRNAS